MGKVLYVQAIDEWVMVCTNEACNKRMIKIVLTDEQVKLLEPRCVGADSGTKRFERIIPISIQDED